MKATSTFFTGVIFFIHISS